MNRATIEHERVKRMILMGLFAAIAYVVMVVGRIPVVMFLKYDPKDVIITIGGFLFGPLSALVISFVVSVVEMFTVSDTGFIGLVMNILSTCAFACVASAIYAKRRTLRAAVIGLVAGSLTMTAVMLLWNYLITPLYLDASREQVAAMLIPMFLPFNLLKSGLNAALTVLLYKPLSSALKRAKLLPASEPAGQAAPARRWGPMIVAGVVLITLILVLLSFSGVI